MRQILGSSNIQGHEWFHILTGNLSHQIEHHIFPDMPARHYARIAPAVQAICRKYNLAYNTGHFSTQFMQVLGRIHHFSQPSAEEWHIYTQSISNSNNHSAVNSATDTAPASHTIISNKQVKRGFRKFLPQVVRQAMFYA